MRSYLLAAGLLALPLTARAADSGAQLGVRGGFSLPAGSIDSAIEFSDVFHGFFPLAAEAGYRVNRNLYLGAFFEYGFGLPANCGASSCWGHTLGGGVEVRYRFFPAGTSVSPWVGLSAGYEQVSRSSGSAANTEGFTANGVQFAAFSLGLDLYTSATVDIGPYITASVGEYLGLSDTSSEASRPVVFEGSPHGFFQLGLRVSFFP
jgi:hypothetical protein